ncbi:hypothetical protein GH714_036243 [Hevea brasiliensis]|uniref:Uncharacterized protein n=1 Tax=Hevea brasiliensis TaxID=3981 RepID=A0A6A6L445_HEVBR|nr:hypothetical protein GH714_036243 [Hevea brasiliensis]
MALAAIIRKSASNLAPLVSRIVRIGHRNYLSALSPPVNHHASFSHSRPHAVLQYYSTASDAKKQSSTEFLLRVIESEIKVAQETDDHDRQMKESVRSPLHATEPTQSSIPLVVTVSKRSGNSLEFHCVAYPDEIAIDSLSVKNLETQEDQVAYEGPNFQDLDEKLRKAFHKYLEIRGIKPSTTTSCMST